MLQMPCYAMPWQAMPRSEALRALLIQSTKNSSRKQMPTVHLHSELRKSVATVTRQQKHTNIHTVMQISSLRTFIISVLCDPALLITVQNNCDLERPPSSGVSTRNRLCCTCALLVTTSTTGGRLSWATAGRVWIGFI